MVEAEESNETLLQLAEEEARHMAQFEAEYCNVIAKEKQRDTE